jgi:hypothetical protein
MTAPVHDGCPDIKITPTPSGGLLLIGREVTQVEHPAELLTAMSAPEPADARLVYLVEETPLSQVAKDFFDGQPFREDIVVVPWSLTGGPQAVGPERAEQFADFLQLQVQMPAAGVDVLAEDPRAGRFVPVDDAGRETGWAAATAVRVLPRTHVAARDAVRLAIRIAAGPESAPWRRLEDLLGRLAGEPVPAPALAAAVHLVLHGVPDGRDPAELTGSAMPMTTARLWQLVGGEPVASFDVLAGLRDDPRGAALVSYRPFHSAPRQIAWVVGDGDRLWWIEPSAEGFATPFDPETDARRHADLTDPDTLVRRVTASAPAAPENSVPTGAERGAGPDAYAWLIEAGFPESMAHRIAGNHTSAFDPARLTGLARLLALDADDTRRLVELSDAVGEIPADLPEVARQLGLAGPGPLFAAARDLALTPQELLPLGDALREVTAGSTAIDPEHGAPWVQRLQEHLAGAGVRTDADLTWLARLRLRPDRFPLLGRMREQGLSLELLGELPPDLLEESLATYAGRESDDVPDMASQAGSEEADGARQLERWNTRLGFDVHRLLPPLPNPYLERLVYEALGDIPPVGVANRLRSALGEAQPAPRPALPRSELAAWATRLQVAADRLDRALSWPGVAPEQLAVLAEEARLTPRETGELVDLVAETGRVPMDLRRWAYLSRVLPGRLAGIGRRLGADPRRMAPLRPMFRRIAEAPAALEPTDDEIAEMVRDFTRAGRLDGPPTVESGLWLAGTGTGPDGHGVAVFDRLLEAYPSALDEAREALDVVPFTVDERHDALTRIARAPGADDPAIAEPLADAVRIAEQARRLLRTLHPAEPVRAITPEPEAGLAAVVQGAVAAVHAARGGHDEPAAFARHAEAVQQVADAAADLAATLRTITADAGRATRMYASEAARQLDGLHDGLPGWSAAWRVLADGPAATEWQEELLSRLAWKPTPPAAAGRTVDLLLTRWWASLTGASPADLGPAIGPSGTLDPRELLRLVEPDGLGAGATELLFGMAVEARMAPHVLRPLVPYLREAGDAVAADLHERIRSSIGRLDATGLPADLTVRLTFLADRGLTLADLDTRPMAVQAGIWRADVLGTGVTLAREVVRQEWFSFDAVTRLFALLREEHAEEARDADWSVATIGRLAADLDVSELWLLSFSLHVGRVPTDVGTLAAEWNVHDPGRLFRLAASLRVDPRGLAGLSDVHALLNASADSGTAVAEAAAASLATGWRPPPAPSLPSVLFGLAVRSGRGPGRILEIARVTRLSIRDLAGLSLPELAAASAAISRSGSQPGSDEPGLLAKVLGDRIGAADSDAGQSPSVDEAYPAWAERLFARLGITEPEILPLVRENTAAEKRIRTWVAGVEPGVPSDRDAEARRLRAWRLRAWRLRARRPKVRRPKVQRLKIRCLIAGCPSARRPTRPNSRRRACSSPAKSARARTLCSPWCCTAPPSKGCRCLRA